MAKNEFDRSQVIFGVILICLGFIFLMNTFGFISWAIWLFLIRFWPIFLILIGLNILFKSTKLWWIIPALVVVLFMVPVFLFNSNYFVNQISIKNHSGTMAQTRSLNKKVERLKVKLDYGAGTLNIGQAQEGTLYKLALKYQDLKPEIIYNADKKTGELSINRVKGFNISGITNNSNKWDIYLNKNIPLDIGITTGAGKLDLDLSELKVDSLDLSSGVSDLTLSLNNYNTNVEIDAGASNLKINIPAVVGIKINTKNVINNNNFKEAGLIKVSDNVYQSKKFDEAENHIIFDISTSASNINLSYR